MQINLSGKLALVCASTRGLGYACAEGLVQSGCSVILTGTSENNLKIAKTKLLSIAKNFASTINIHEILVDLNSQSEIDILIDSLEKLPSIDIFIANSGGPSPGDFESFSTAQEFENKARQITYPATKLMKYVLPAMKEKKWGRIINISSIGLAKPITGLAVSNASRGYLAGLMTGMANENARYGITINTILPGIIWTDRQKLLTENDANLLGISFDEMFDRKSSSIPSGNMGKPDDVGSLVTFLSSDYAGYINSQFIAVDGGLLGLVR